MSNSSFNKKLSKFVKTCRITDGKSFKLKHFDPAETFGFDTENKPRFTDFLSASIELCSDLQDKLYAEAKHGLILIFQAMDAAGKDGTIKHVMSGINPQGCNVTSFKAPSHLELAHDYLWRCQLVLPPRGYIAIFNRSYYEEVLAVRVHPELLHAQHLPHDSLENGKSFWKKRLHDIAQFEDYLSENGFVIRKFFLHLSKNEQKKRFMERLDDPKKNWKFSSSDLSERGHWDHYQTAYEEAIAGTASKSAPWYVIPADHKWVTRAMVSAVIADTLLTLDPQYPMMPEVVCANLDAARKALLNEKE